LFFNFNVIATIKKYHEATKDDEMYTINPPTVMMLKNLFLIWIIFFITFLLTFNGLQSFFLFLWIPMILLLYFYSNLWTKVGFSLIVYWLLNIVAIVSGYFISKVIQFIIKFILKLIGVI
jgi:hypothetical protein